MKRNAILSLFRSLSCSQGFYGGLLSAIEEDEEWGNDFLDELEKKNFKDEVDLILYIESY